MPEKAILRWWWMKIWKVWTAWSLLVTLAGATFWVGLYDSQGWLVTKGDDESLERWQEVLSHSHKQERQKVTHMLGVLIFVIWSLLTSNCCVAEWNHQTPTALMVSPLSSNNLRTHRAICIIPSRQAIGEVKVMTRSHVVPNTWVWI